MSYVYGHVCVVAGGCAVVAWQVTNISDKAIGVDASIPRCAATRLAPCNSRRLLEQDVRGHTIAGEETGMGFVPSAELSPSDFSIENEVETDVVVEKSAVADADALRNSISSIAPGETVTFYRVVAVDEFYRAAEDKSDAHRHAEHSVIRLNAQLDLAHPVTSQALDEIQVRPFQIQVATPFSLEFGITKALLVVNDRTTSDEIHAWRHLCAGLLGTPRDALAVWNVSLYGGLSFKYKVPASVNGTPGNDLESLAKRFSTNDSIIVVLNNSCTSSGVRLDTTEETVMRGLCQDELLHACKYHGCRFYIPGSTDGFAWRQALQLPVAEQSVRMLNSASALTQWAPSILWPDDLVVSSVMEDRPPTTDAEVVPANASCDLKGTFRKKKKSGVGTVKRVFMLQKSEQMLYYFAKENSSKPLASFHIDSSLSCELLESNWLKIETSTRELLIQPVSSGKQDVGDLLNDWKDGIDDVMVSKFNPQHEQKGLVHDLEQRGFDMACPPDSNVACAFRVLRRNAGNGNIVKKQAEKVAADLASTFPELLFSVVYRHIASEEQERNRGMIAAQRGIGDITVYSGAHYDGGAAVVDLSEHSTEVQAGDRFVHEAVESQRNLYGFLKGLSFERKVSLLRNSSADGKARLETEDQNDNWLFLLVDAISSDIADELAVFSFGRETLSNKSRNLLRPSKKNGAVTKWASRMRRVKTLGELPDLGRITSDSKKFDEVFRLCATLQMVMKRLVPVTERVMKVSRKGIIFLAARTAIDHLASLLCDVAGVKKQAHVRNSEGKSLDVLQREWKRAGVPWGREEDGAPERDLLGSLRTRHGFGVPWAADASSGEHVPHVIAADEFESMCAQTTRATPPAIGAPVPWSTSTKPSPAALRQFLDNYAPSPENVTPIEV